MEAKDAILKRRSIRKYKDMPVEDEKITALIEAADAAPSACNKRPLKFYVIKNKELLERLADSGRFTSFYSPLAIVVAGDMDKVLPRSFSEYWIHDAAAATENILIRATDLGLGTCWCGIYLQEGVLRNVQDLLSMPKSIIPFSLIKIGYADEIREAHEGYEPTRVEILE